jgi:polyisoprenoid-binding protein YceI
MSMRCMKTAPLLCLLLVHQLCGPGHAAARAEDLSLEIDPTASKIAFDFGATFHSVEGTLQMQGGSIHFDPATGAASGEVAAAAATAATGIVRRDRKMHEKILESAAFPTIVFKAERIDGTLNRAGRSNLQLRGTLTLHGVTLPASIATEVQADHDQIHATGYLTVPYLSYGMQDPSFFILRVEKEVSVVLHVTGRLVPTEPPAPPPASATTARPPHRSSVAPATPAGNARPELSRTPKNLLISCSRGPSYHRLYISAFHTNSLRGPSESNGSQT